MADNGRAHIGGKHQCNIQLNNTRKLIAKQLDRTKEDMKKFFLVPGAGREMITPRMEWLKGSVNVCNDHNLEYADSAFQHALTALTRQHSILRAVQLRVNKARKQLGDRDPLELCSCGVKHFCQDAIAWHECIIEGVTKAFECKSPAVLDSSDNNQHLGHDEETCFWAKLYKVDRNDIVEVDDLLLLIQDMRNSTELAEKYEITNAFCDYLEEYPQVCARFEAGALKEVQYQIEVFIELWKCAEQLAGGDPDWMPRENICRKTTCGLHGLVDQIFHEAPYLPDIRDKELNRICCNAVDELFDPSTSRTDLTDVGKIMVEYFRDAVEVYDLENMAFQETVDFIDSVCDRKELSIAEQVDGDLARAEPTLSPLVADAATAARNQAELDQIQENIKKEGYLLDPAKDPGVLYKPLRSHDPSEDTSSALAQIESRHDSLSQSSSDFSDPDKDKENQCPSNEPQTHVSEAAETASNHEDALVDQQLVLSEKLPSKVSVTPSHMSGKRKASLTDSNERKLKSKTIAKYYQRGYGKAFDTSTKRKTNEENVHERVWCFTNEQHYFEVWRIIFPRTQQDRKHAFVSWNLFVAAMKASPISCNIKKAAGVEWVFERMNDSGGREVFQCHAPHQLDWIPQGDLYRYRKDLRDTFGMDVNRLVLNGEVVPSKSRKCDRA